MKIYGTFAESLTANETSLKNLNTPTFHTRFFQEGFGPSVVLMQQIWLLNWHWLVSSLTLSIGRAGWQLSVPICGGTTSNTHCIYKDPLLANACSLLKQ